MTTIKEVCLGVAVAGFVAGAGSAVATAVANADTGEATASTGSSTSAGPVSHARSRGPAVKAAAAAQRNRAAVTKVPAAPAASRQRGAAVAAPGGPGASFAAVRGRAAVASAVAAVAADEPVHVLLIGTDGTNLSKVLADPANVGFFNLMDQSVTGAATLVGHTTLSGPSWSTILTGAWDTKTGIVGNLFNPAPYNSWPTAFNLLEYNKPEIATSIVADWKYLNDMADAGGYPVDQNFYYSFSTSWADTDTEVVNKTINLINTTPADASSFMFSYQAQVDEAGHSYGGGSPEYAQAVTNVSNNIQQIMDAVSARELATGEDWTVIVTTDHGHQQSLGFGHGFQSPNETSSFVILDLAGDSANDGKQNLNYSVADITPTIVSLFGVPQRSDFDGVPMDTDPAVLSSIVTPVNLKQALGDAVGMYGYPDTGTSITLGIRTVFAAIPYFIEGFVTSITGQLQSIVDQQIFVISTLAGATELAVQLIGDGLVGVTEAVARVVASLTGAGSIAPTDPPLPAPPVAALPVAIGTGSGATTLV
ncbi:MAG: alkaline phosphatase family protein [Mycobacterium sp.]